MNRFTSQRSVLVSVVLCVSLLCSGCVYVVIGSLGALGGYIVSPDTVEGTTTHDQNDVWDAAVEIISIMGVIEERAQAGGMILAKVNKIKVTVNVLPINASTTKVTIKARRGVFPKIGLAQDVYIKIIRYLNE